MGLFGALAAEEERACELEASHPRACDGFTSVC